MQMTDILAQFGGMQSMARELGVDEAQVATGAEALIPAIVGGFKHQAQAQPSGLEELGGMLDRLGGGGLLDEVLAPQPTDVNRGNDVLRQIFGSRDVSRTVANNAAAQTGLDASLLKKMLPMLAMLVGGFMARQQGTSAGSGFGGPDLGLGGAGAAPAGGLGDLLGGLLGGAGAAAGGAAPGRGAGGLASILDLNGDGNPLDDILRMAGKALR